jgi:hypothetical protein
MVDRYKDDWLIHENGLFNNSGAVDAGTREGYEMKKR